MTGELGFNNTYALVMRRDRAAKLGIGKISDLRNHPELSPGLTHEFLDRQDGWAPLSARYGLQMRNVLGDRSRAWLRCAGEWFDRPKRRLFDGREESRKTISLCLMMIFIFFRNIKRCFCTGSIWTVVP